MGWRPHEVALLDQIADDLGVATATTTITELRVVVESLRPRIVLVPAEVFRLDPASFVELGARHGATIAPVVPPFDREHLQQWLANLLRDDDEPSNCLAEPRSSCAPSRRGETQDVEIARCVEFQRTIRHRSVTST